MPQHSAPTLERTNAIVADDSRFILSISGSVLAECPVYPAIPRDQNIIVVDLMALHLPACMSNTVVWSPSYGCHYAA